ncbi:O-antigen ligase family protein, partial [Candidatus Saccharibacteria bacterium]|nr:O-antigen ligase family protein [Candidatus Saccharibacteria bacterium]
FGFSHPNGWAIEPQFMGNLLLAPAIVAAWMLGNCNSASRGRVFSLIALVFVFAATIFLTFSRGAIYAFVVAMIFMTAMLVVRTKKWRAMLVWPVILVAFLFTLNLQGMMAEFGPTSDTYGTGMAKVLNHLSLGIIDVRGSDEEKVSEETDALELEITEENVGNDEKSEAVFDGYVEESTDTRLRLTGAAVEVWKQDFATMMFGVGIGGAGQALYVNGLSPAPKEIVQNQYASLLLETGLVGVALLILTMGLIIRAVYKNGMVMTLIVAYAITLLFFSGLPNALQIYLLPMLFTALCGKSSYRK